MQKIIWTIILSLHVSCYLIATPSYVITNNLTEPITLRASVTGEGIIIPPSDSKSVQSKLRDDRSGHNWAIAFKLGDINYSIKRIFKVRESRIPGLHGNEQWIAQASWLNNAGNLEIMDIPTNLPAQSQEGPLTIRELRISNDPNNTKIRVEAIIL